MNRLASATSPYLLQHADNPVDWWEWSAEAFEEAKRRDVPVLISIGYAACHWCHVMAHESFENPDVADAVNRSFVAIKVDREERPDVDAVYMTATQAMTGQGGWPMTVFATPDGQPFFCGTYYPRAAFVRLLEAVGQTWRDQRSAVLRQSAQVVDTIAQAQGLGGFESGSITTELLDRAVARLKDDFDGVHAGFGGAPKFPPSMVLLALLRHHQRTGDPDALEMVRATAEAMARGGIYDQLAGGFARYSVDDHWLVPHFEKMLYDNAQLLRAYTMLFRLTGDPLARRIADEVAGFLLADLRGEGFLSSLDADTGGVEGATYAWTPAQLREALGTDDGDWAADLFGVTQAGTFEHGASVLALRRDVDAADEPVRARWRAARTTLRQVRDLRPQPSRDDKVVTAWNGLALTAVAEYLMVIESPELLRASLDVADFLDRVHIVDGRLRRASRGGAAGEPPGVLEDYGCLAEAFCALHQLTGSGRWLDRAGQLLDAALAHFDNGAGGFFDTADDAESLVARPADPTDNATPSGLSSLAAALVAYSALTGDPRYRERAQQAIETIAPLLERGPRYAGYSAATAEALLSGPHEVAISGGEGDLAATARRLAPPGAVVVVGPPDAPGVPLLMDRPLLDGQPTAYVCRGFVCERPVTTVEDLTALLAGGSRSR